MPHMTMSDGMDTVLDRPGLAHHDDPRIDTSRSWPVTPVHTGKLPGHSTWRRSDVSEADWAVTIPDGCLAEIDAAITLLRDNPIPTLALSHTDFAMPRCRQMMAQVKGILDTGIGFAVLDRLPAEAYSKAELLTVYWLLSQMIARPVAQAFKGTLLYDVHDTGQKTSTRVRADLTSQDLSWHTDYGFNHPPPYIGLLVLQTAKSGGESSAGSLHTAHDILRQREPALLQRLYQPYVWNRQGEHPDDAPICTSNPIFSAWDGTLRARYNRGLQPVGYRLVGAEIDKPGMDALNALHDILSEPENHVDFVLAPGQMEFLNNARIAHRRTAFVDHEDPALKRHLMRIFLRDEGRRSYMG
jgi:alpha-ketoglutarate-dependent taurine dioxygenase